MSPGDSSSSPSSLEIFNDQGRLDPNGGSLVPFGSLPLVESAFVFGSTAQAHSALTGLSIRLEWDGLPADFEERYKAYGAARSDFKVRLERYEAGTLVAPDSAPNLFPLFPSHGDLTRIELPARLQPYWRGRESLSAVPPSPKENPYEGFLRLSLVAPVNGCGSALYPKLVAEISLENAARILKGLPAAPLPPPPFVPRLRRMTLLLNGREVV